VHGGHRCAPFAALTAVAEAPARGSPAAFRAALAARRSNAGLARRADDTRHIGTHRIRLVLYLIAVDAQAA